MNLRESEVRGLAARVLARLEKAGLVKITGDRARLEARIDAAFQTNVQAEREIEAAAERFAESHSRELVGMDRHRVLHLVKERIAKEKGFTL